VPTPQREPLALLVAGVVLLVLSGIAPRDRFTWVLEVAPILIGAPILVATRRRFGSRRCSIACSSSTRAC